MYLYGTENLNFQGYIISRLFCDFVVSNKNKRIFSYHFFLFLSNVCCLSSAHPNCKKK